jgi:hypothetical protein
MVLPHSPQAPSLHGALHCRCCTGLRFSDSITDVAAAGAFISEDSLNPDTPFVQSVEGNAAGPTSFDREPQVLPRGSPMILVRGVDIILACGVGLD